MLCKCPGHTEPLLLTAGQTDTSFTDYGLGTVFKFFYKAKCTSLCKSFLDISFLYTVLIAQTDIFIYRIREKEYVLHNYGSSFSYSSKRKLPDIPAVEQYLTAFGIIEPQQHVDDGSLTGTGSSHDTESLSAV